MEKHIDWSLLYSLKEENINSLDSNLAGVYRLSYKDMDGKFYVFFVGQSDDIKKSLEKHNSKEEENICILNYVSSKECSFRYSKITDKDVSEATLWQAYSLYQPTCNIGVPARKHDITVNLNNKK